VSSTDAAIDYVVPSGIPLAPVDLNVSHSSSVGVLVALSHPSVTCADYSGLDHTAVATEAEAAADVCSGKPVSKVKVWWSTGASFAASSTLSQIVNVPPESGGLASMHIVGLATNTKYYVKAAFKNSIGWGPETVGGAAAASSSIYNSASGGADWVRPLGNGASKLWAATSCKMVLTNFAVPAPTTGIFWVIPVATSSATIRGTLGTGEASSSSYSYDEAVVNADAFPVYCDMSYNGGGWMLATKLYNSRSNELDNHLSHKFSGAVWYSGDAASLQAMDTTPATDPSLALLPFTLQDSWGSIDSSRLEYGSEMILGESEDDNQGDMLTWEYMDFDLSGGSVSGESYANAFRDSSKWPQTSTVLGNCIAKRSDGWDSTPSSSCGSTLHFAGDNVNVGNYMDSQCLTSTYDTSTLMSKNQALCLLTTSGQITFGINFMTAEVSTDALSYGSTSTGINEACVDDKGGDGCRPAPSRRLELWFR
jgi:hypothetical protein